MARQILGLATLLALLAPASCGKSVDLSSRQGSAGPEQPVPTPTPTHPTLEVCTAGNRKTWTFQQPQPVRQGKVDLLFVVDTSRSLEAERGRIASTLPSFVNQLDPVLDYRIGVMLAHGSASSRSGRLYAAPGSPLVLDSRSLSTAEVQADLQATLARPVGDVDEANGEAMLLSLANSLSPSKLSEARKAGFYRTDAALAVVFLSDENDVCYPPEDHGYTKFPDFVDSSPPGYERKAYEKHCLDLNGRLKITPASTLAALKKLQGTRHLAMGGIVHVDPALVPKGTEASIGHGILETLALDIDSIPMDIESASYSDGLRRLGDVVSSQLTLLTEFVLGGSPTLISGTLAAFVDGKVTAAVLDPATGKVRIAAENAGGAGSVIEISACVK